MPAYKPIETRLRDLTVVNPETGCWHWAGHVDKCGYGKTSWTRPDGSKETLAHRASYRHFVGEIPEGWEIDHKCRNRNCCNPRHLQAVTHRENVERGDYISNHRNRRKTHCKRGHELSGNNLVVRMVGDKTRRACRACDNMRARNKNQRHDFGPEPKLFECFGELRSAKAWAERFGVNAATVRRRVRDGKNPDGSSV